MVMLKMIEQSISKSFWSMVLILNQLIANMVQMRKIVH